MAKKLITESEVIKSLKMGLKELVVEEGTILTPSARDCILHSGIKIISNIKQLEVNKSEISERIVVGADHTGVDAKSMLIEYLKKRCKEVIDLGTNSKEAVDYPDIALKIAGKVASGEAKYGVLIDATGIPSSIAANKVPGIRAATCYNEFSARSSREHNDSNILVLGARCLGDEAIKSIAEVWLSSKFLGERHQRRLDKIKSIEEMFSK